MLGAWRHAWLAWKLARLWRRAWCGMQCWAWNRLQGSRSRLWVVGREEGVPVVGPAVPGLYLMQCGTAGRGRLACARGAGAAAEQPWHWRADTVHSTSGASMRV